MFHEKQSVKSLPKNDLQRWNSVVCFLLVSATYPARRARNPASIPGGSWGATLTMTFSTLSYKNLWVSPKIQKFFVDFSAHFPESLMKWAKGKHETWHGRQFKLKISKSHPKKKWIPAAKKPWYFFWLSIKTLANQHSNLSVCEWRPCVLKSGAEALIVLRLCRLG